MVEGSASPAAKDGREEFFKKFLEVLRVPLVKSAAAFFDNIKQTESLVWMPFVFFSFLEIDSHFYNSLLASVREHWGQVDYYTFLKDHTSGKPFKVAEAIPDFMDRIQKRSDEILSHSSYGSFFKSSMDVLHSAAISASWTAFECLATDLWVNALNEYPVPLAHSALSNVDVQEPGELTSKQIPVGMAAKYGFDLRHCLGTLLKGKFDFTSMSGIQKAYRIFIPPDEFTRDFGNPLSGLEATRNLIVHRSSKVDDAYRKRTGSSLSIGTVLTFSQEEVFRFVRASEKVGYGLLACVSDCLQKNVKDGAPVAAPDAMQGPTRT